MPASSSAASLRSRQAALPSPPPAERATRRPPVAERSRIGYESARERGTGLDLKERDLSTDVDGLYRRYGPMVLRRCRFLLRDEHQALDAMQDVFVNVLRRRDSLTGEAPSALLYKVATNVCLNRMRSARRNPQDADDALLLKIAALDDLEEKTAAQRLLERLFGNEPASSRTIAVMHLVDGMTLEETAAHVGLSVSGVRKRLRTLKARLQALEESR